MGRVITLHSPMMDVGYSYVGKPNWLPINEIEGMQAFVVAELQGGKQAIAFSMGHVDASLALNAAFPESSGSLKYLGAGEMNWARWECINQSGTYRPSFELFSKNVVPFLRDHEFKIIKGF